MASFSYKNIGLPLDLNNWEDLNDNFSKVGQDLYAQNARIDGIAEEITGELAEQILDNAKINWLEPVDTFSELTTAYPTASEGDAVFIRDTGKVFRFNGTQWTEIQEIDPVSVNVVEQIVNRKPDFLNLTNTGVKPVFLAHRGASTSAPENTIPAFQLAGEFGFSGIETDIWRTTDGVWVCMHDETVDRTTNGTGTTEALTSTYINSLMIDAGSNVALYDSLKVPTLQEFLTVCKKYDCTPVIEVKGVNTIPYLSELIGIFKTMGVYETVQLEFGDQATATAFREIDKKIILHLLTGTTQAAVDFVKNLGNAIASMVYTSATAEVVNLFHQNGIPVATFGVVNMSHVLSQINNNVDFIITDVHGGDIK